MFQHPPEPPWSAFRGTPEMCISWADVFPRFKYICMESESGGGESLNMQMICMGILTSSFIAPLRASPTNQKNMEYSPFLTAPLSLTDPGTQVHASDSSHDTISTAPYKNNNARQRAARVQSAPNPPPVLNVLLPTVSVVLPNHVAAFLMQYPCVGVRSKVAITTREHQRMNEAMKKKEINHQTGGVFVILQKKFGARGTRRAATRHSQAARVHTNCSIFSD